MCRHIPELGTTKYALVLMAHPVYTRKLLNAISACTWRLAASKTRF